METEKQFILPSNSQTKGESEEKAICMLIRHMQGRLVHKGDWGDALPTGKGDFFFCRILPLDRLFCL